MKEAYEYIVVGGGISGLTSLERLAGKGRKVICLEQERECGGLLRSSYKNGYLLEAGANSFLRSYKHTLELINRIGLDDRVISNRPGAVARFLVKNQKLCRVPEGICSFLFSPFLSFKAKMRLLLEPFIASGEGEETIKSFSDRLFGKEVSESIMDPVISGICAGDISKLDMHSCFPKIAEIRKRFKSLLLFLMLFKKRHSGGKAMFYSLKDGMGEIANRIYERHSDKIFLDQRVSRVRKVGDYYRVDTQHGSYVAQKIVFATPAFITAGLVKDISSELGKSLEAIPYTNIVTVALTIKKEAVKHAFNGFGFLVPRKEKFHILGGFFSSSLFEERAPEDEHLLKIYIGGEHDRAVCDLNDSQIKAIVQHDLEKLFGISDVESFLKINRISNAIPELNIGHQKIKKEIKLELGKMSGLFLVGNYLEGISVNESIKSSETLEDEDLEKDLPPIVKHDSYLAPFAGDIKRRELKLIEKEVMLTGEGESLSSFANGHLYYGMHKTYDGWIFREWAPNAINIFLVGEFSDWQEQEKFRLTRINDSGVWEIKLPLNELHHLDYYRLNIHWPGGHGERIPTYANYVVQDKKTHLFCARIWDPVVRYQFKNKAPVNHDAPIIYESHVGMGQIDAKVGTYKEFQEKILPRIVDGGYNTVQIMAIQEHPYYGSFGYQVSNFFAPSSRFGTPDELKELIDTAHGMGLKVIMDIVHSHAVKNEVEGLGKFDGTQYQFFHDGGKGLHPAWDTMCFNYGKDEVIHFLLSNCKYWMEEFGFDGFRFDGVTSMLYHSHGLGQAFGSYHDYFNMGVDEDALIYLGLANKVIHQVKEDAISIAEDMSGMPGLAAPFSHGGFGFDYRLSMGLPDFWIKLLKEKKDNDWSMDNIWHELTNRRQDEDVISYAESHDQALVGDKTLIFWLIDKDMYFHMATHNRNLVVDRGIALHKMIRLVTIATGRGGYLNFMGNEFGHPEWIDFPREGNNWSYHHARRRWDLRDDENLCYRFLADFDRKMINLIKDNSLLNIDDPKLRLVHCDDHVLGFERDKFLFVFNFDPERSYTQYMFEVEEGTYRQVLSSDSGEFGGFDRLPDGQLHETFESKISLYLPSRVAVVLEKIS